MKKKLAMLFGIVLLALVILILRITYINATSGSKYKKQVLSQAQQKYESQVLPAKRGDIYDKNGNKTEIFNTILRLTTLDEDTVVKIMNNETANDILTDIVNSIYDYHLTGDEQYKYTSKQIIDIVENNMDKVLSEIDYSISEEDRKSVMNYTKNHTDEIIDTIYKTDIGDYQK